MTTEIAGKRLVEQVRELVILLERLYGLERKVFHRVWAEDVYRYLCLGCAALIYPLKDEAQDADPEEITQAMKRLIMNGGKGNFMGELNKLNSVGSAKYIDDYLNWVKEMMRLKTEQFATGRLGTKFEPRKSSSAYRLLSLNALAHSFELVKGFVAFVANLLEKAARKPDPATFSEVAKIGAEIMRNPDARQINIEAKRLLQLGFDGYIKGGIAFVLTGPEWERWGSLRKG